MLSIFFIHKHIPKYSIHNQSSNYAAPENTDEYHLVITELADVIAQCYNIKCKVPIVFFSADMACGDLIIYSSIS